MNWHKCTITASLGLAFLLIGDAGAQTTVGGTAQQTANYSPTAGPRRIALFPGDREQILHDASVPIWDREEGVVIAGPSNAQLDVLRAQGIEPIFSAPDNGDGIHILSHDRYFTPPVISGLPRYQINDGAMLYLIPAGLQMDLPRLRLHAQFHGVPRVALKPARVHPADTAARTMLLAPNGLVQQIVDATSQASWFQYVRDLSGDSDVTIPGYCTNCRIRTRASNYMFPINNTGNPLGNPFATEYLEDKAAGWGFTAANAVRESYTSANSGCTARQGSLTWQNVVFTLPAQVDYAQNQQVIFLVHYDTISESAANDANNAPGADDAISGGSALLEAMRLFKDYGWQYTVKFLFVSGEEVGLCGSTAYTRMHPTAPMWRVLNMDQTAFDGNKDGLMNLYNWSTASCPSCVAFGDAFVQANADYGNIINPAKIVRNTTKMCQTDHCPFWNVGVTAIDLNEDLTHNDICPCFDQFQTSLCRDTVTQVYPLGGTTLMFDQNYSWPTEKAAIALIANTAVPLYACPASGATVSATSGAAQVQVTWPDVPPVTNYVVERADGGCGGTFAGIASATSASYTDNAVTAGSTYGYRVRTCPFQVSNCVVAVVQGATTTTASSAPNPSASGQPVTFTSTTTSSAGVPAGTVTFTEGATVLASNVTVNSSGQASFSTAALAVGSHTITASFTGANAWTNSSGDAPAHVVNNATTTTASSSPNPSAFGQPVTFTSTTTSSGGVPAGTVTFTEGVTVLASNVTVDGSGQASFSTTALAVGSHTITATFTGASGWANSSGNAAPQGVNGTATSTTATSSPNPSAFGQPVTFTSTTTSSAGVPAGTVTFTEGATVLASNISVNGSGDASFSTAALAAGSHTITATFTGTSGWANSSGNALPQVVNSIATSTTASSSPNPSAFGQSVTFTSTTTSSGGVPAGTVTFTEGATVLASNVTVNGSGQAAFSTVALAAGSHTITATFTGASGWANSSGSALPQVVNSIATSTTASSSPNPSAFGQSVTFTSTTTSSGGVPAGTVTFTEGATVLASNRAVNGSGQASFSTTALAVGSHTITATFSGANGWANSSGNAAPQLVNSGSTSTTATSSPNPSVSGQPVTFTSTTTSSAGVPAGTVTFKEGTTVLAANVTVDGTGHASFSTTALSVANHTINAAFTGAPGWANSSGNAARQTVNKAATTTAVSSSSNPSVFSQPVTFTATVTATAPGSGVPTGTATFKNGNSTLGTGTVNGSGIATFTTSTLAVGARSITAVYGGSTSFSSSTSPVLTQTVNQDSTTASVTSSLNPSVHNQSVTFTATVAANAPGTATPTGTVTFKNGATTLSTKSLSAGRATYTTSSLSAGPHQITVVYTGNSSFLTSTSPVLVQTVN